MAKGCLSTASQNACFRRVKKLWKLLLDGSMLELLEYIVISTRNVSGCVALASATACSINPHSMQELRLLLQEHRYPLLCQEAEGFTLRFIFKSLKKGFAASVLKKLFRSAKCCVFVYWFFKQTIRISVPIICCPYSSNNFCIYHVKLDCFWALI